MDEKKLILVMVLFIIFGLVFIIAGLYFSSEKYLSKIAESVLDEKKSKQIKKTGKLCGYVSISIGSFTIFCGIICKVLPQLFSVMSLFYVIILIIGFSLISISFKNK